MSAVSDFATVREDAAYGRNMMRVLEQWPIARQAVREIAVAGDVAELPSLVDSLASVDTGAALPRFGTASPRPRRRSPGQVLSVSRPASMEPRSATLEVSGREHRDLGAAAVFAAGVARPATSSGPSSRPRRVLHHRAGRAPPGLTKAIHAASRPRTVAVRHPPAVAAAGLGSRSGPESDEETGSADEVVDAAVDSLVAWIEGVGSAARAAMPPRDDSVEDTYHGNRWDHHPDERHGRKPRLVPASESSVAQAERLPGVHGRTPALTGGLAMSLTVAPAQRGAASSESGGGRESPSACTGARSAVSRAVVRTRAPVAASCGDTEIGESCDIEVVASTSLYSVDPRSRRDTGVASGGQSPQYVIATVSPSESGRSSLVRSAIEHTTMQLTNAFQVRAAEAVVVSVHATQCAQRTLITIQTEVSALRHSVAARRSAGGERSTSPDGESGTVTQRPRTTQGARGPLLTGDSAESRALRARPPLSAPRRIRTPRPEGSAHTGSNVSVVAGAPAAVNGAATVKSVAAAEGLQKWWEDGAPAGNVIEVTAVDAKHAGRMPGPGKTEPEQMRSVERTPGPVKTEPEQMRSVDDGDAAAQGVAAKAGSANAARSRREGTINSRRRRPAAPPSIARNVPDALHSTTWSASAAAAATVAAKTPRAALELPTAGSDIVRPSQPSALDEEVEEDDTSLRGAKNDPKALRALVRRLRQQRDDERAASRDEAFAAAARLAAASRELDTARADAMSSRANAASARTALKVLV